MRHRRLYRTVFAAAGIYNLTWGTWIALHPTSLYSASAIPVPGHPEVAGVLGMVIGLYGLLYLDVARRPEHGWLIAAVGLVGKIVGPAALAWHITAGNWPADGLFIVAFNDIIWWAPFAAYLRHAWPYLHTRPDPSPPPREPLRSGGS